MRQTTRIKENENVALHYSGCAVCGTWRTHEHHIVKRRLGGVETITLCPKHHAMAERGKIPPDLLWSFLRDRSIGWELADDLELSWELEYHRDVMMYTEVQFHDFYGEEYDVCLYPPSLDPENRGVYRQCMVSLWLNGKRELDLDSH